MPVTISTCEYIKNLSGILKYSRLQMSVHVYPVHELKDLHTGILEEDFRTLCATAVLLLLLYESELSHSVLHACSLTCWYTW